MSKIRNGQERDQREKVVNTADDPRGYKDEEDFAPESRLERKAWLYRRGGSSPTYGQVREVNKK